jgi:two-component system, chemotaxis family, chemotaxis protein CheY
MIPAPHIVLIDDNVAWLESLAEYFRSKGLVVFTASDPRQGLELLEGNAVNVVISDFNLPYMDGLQVLRSVRLRGGNISVFLLSSEEEPGLEKKVLAEGAVGFFCKTTEPALLLRSLLQAVAALTGAANGSAVLEIWQRLLPSPHASGRRNRLEEPVSERSETWQRLLPNPNSPGPFGCFDRVRMPKPAA